MSVLIIVLLFITFLQSALLPLNLVLIILICRSFIAHETLNYWLAFWFGLLLTILLGYSLGSLGLIYLLIVVLVHLIRKSQLASSWLMILPVSLVILSLEGIVEGLLFKTGFSLQNIVLQMIFVLPIYLLMRFWEERFIPKKEIRLKVGK